MANLKQNVSFDSKAYAQLSEALSTSLRKSPTAYTPNTAPTASDISQQISLMSLRQQAEFAQNEKLRQKTYGSEPAPQYDLNNLAPEKQSGIVKGLHALATPLYAITGAIQAVTGTGAKKGLANVFDAVRTHQTSGDTLRKLGVTSPWATIPLGFALDVALDPVAWGMAGTNALIPKLGTGLLKGGGEGLVAAAKAGGLQKLSTLTKAIPVITKGAMRTKVATKAVEAENVFRNLVGKPTVIEEALSNKAGLLGAKNLYTKFSQAANPEGNAFQKSMAWLQKNFEYSPTKRIQGDMADEVAMAKEKASGVKGSLDQLIQETGGSLELGDDVLSRQLDDLAKGQAYKENLLVANKGAFNPPAKGVLASQGSADVVKGMKQVADDIAKVGQVAERRIKGTLTDTGWAFYDNLVKKINSNPYGQKAWQTLAYASGIFKLAKVPLNYLTAYTNAAVSNLVMAGMYGVNISDMRYLNMLKESRRLISGGAISEDLARSITPEINALFKTYAETAAGSIGLNEKMVSNAIAKMISDESGKPITGSWADWKNIQDIMRKTEFMGDFNPDEALADLNKLRETAQASREAARVAGKKVAGDIGKLENLQTKADTVIMTGEQARPTLPEMTSFISEDVMSSPLGATLEKWAESGNNFKEFIAKMLLKSQQHYNSIDQTYKIATFLHLSVNGVSGPELARIAKSLSLEAKDISLVNGFYRISPEKAMIAANEIAMDYAAMPTAIRVLRNMPLLGSPFASFSYGSMSKLGKTLVNNPEYLNRVTFARQEISGTQSPLDKVALGGPYYNYLNRYERMKLPFFQDHPLYLNIANWVPYLSLNFFQPTERDYSDTAGGDFLRVIDQLPFLKTPEGQILVDTVIQPFILNEAHPTGMFGQNVWPEGGTAFDKAKTVGLDVAGNYVPNLTPFLGFRFNQFVNATQGKNAAGIQSAHPASQLVLQWMGSVLGVPISPVNLQSLGSGLKKQLNVPTK